MGMFNLVWTLIDQLLMRCIEFVMYNTEGTGSSFVYILQKIYNSVKG